MEPTRGYAKKNADRLPSKHYSGDYKAAEEEELGSRERYMDSRFQIQLDEAESDRVRQSWM